MSAVKPRRAWPGWDGWVLLSLGLLGLAVYVGRGQVAGLWHLSIVLLLDVAYLGVTWRLRR